MAVFIETPEARQIPLTTKTRFNRFTIVMLSTGWWKVRDAFGVYKTGDYKLFAGAELQKEALEAYERGDIAEAGKLSGWALYSDKGL